MIVLQRRVNCFSTFFGWTKIVLPKGMLWILFFCFCTEKIYDKISPDRLISKLLRNLGCAESVRGNYDKTSKNLESKDLGD